jgi:hypothetical protein
VDDGGEDDALLARAELGDAPHRRAVLIGARPELERLLEREAAALLEQGARGGMRARQGR